MASLFIIRIPGWRTFVFQLPTFRELMASFGSLIIRTTRSRVFAAIEQGSDDEVLRLATPRRLRKARGEWGESPLVAAIAAGRSELACLLVSRGGILPGDGALAHAAMRGDVKVVDALLAAGKDPDESLKGDYTDGVTPLMWSTNRKLFACMESLLAAGANINAQSRDGTTAVMYTRSGKADELQALEILCRYQPDISIKDWRGRNLIREAQDRERNSADPAMRILLERYFPEIDFEKPDN